MKKILKYVPIYSVVLFAFFIFSLIFGILISNLDGFATGYNQSVGYFFRSLIASMTNPLPFSLAQILVFLIIPILALVVWRAVVSFKDKVKRVRFVVGFVSVLTLFYSLFTLTLGFGYQAAPLKEQLGYTDTEITREDIENTLENIISELVPLSEKINYGEDGASVMPYDLDTLSDKLCKAYKKIEDEYGILKTFETRAKVILMDDLFGYAGISGIYSYFTGEANVNTVYTDYNRPFTVAHEFAHQRGIARENEANFVAFLTCINSDDDFIRYSGYLNIFEYVISSYARHDVDAYRELYTSMPTPIKNDIKASNAVIRYYADTFIGDVSDTVNDTYLKLQGTEGTISYSLVTRLAVAYYKEK